MPRCARWMRLSSERRSLHMICPEQALWGWAERVSRPAWKLSPKEPDKIDYIIANCAECEPYITADYRRMLENTRRNW